MGYLALLLIGGFGLPFVMLTVFSTVVSISFLAGALLLSRHQSSGRIVCTAASLAAAAVALCTLNITAIGDDRASRIQR